MKLVGKKYIVSTEDGERYRFYLRIPMPLYCFDDSDISIHSAVRYSDARKFRSLRWATHRARFLSKHSDSLYYVFTVEQKVDGICLLKMVDDTINDKLIEKQKRYSDKIEKIINNWKAERGIAIDRKEL